MISGLFTHLNTRGYEPTPIMLLKDGVLHQGWNVNTKDGIKMVACRVCEEHEYEQLFKELEEMADNPDLKSNRKTADFMNTIFGGKPEG